MELNIPIIIHARDSLDDLIELVTEEKNNNNLRGIFHCFGGSIDQAKKIIDLGFSMGIGGVLTYKNSGLDAVVKDIPLEYIVLETDAPYLSPVPYRGKRNESAYLLFIAKKLAEIKGMRIEEISEFTSNNALKIFHNT